MLTRSEQRFVQSPETFSKSQRRLYRYRINKKIKKFVSDLNIIIERNEKLGLNLRVLDELSSTAKAFQNSETSRQKTVSDSVVSKNSILDRYENW